jgi:hypothetical protein
MRSRPDGAGLAHGGRLSRLRIGFLPGKKRNLYQGRVFPAVTRGILLPFPFSRFGFWFYRLSA